MMNFLNLLLCLSTMTIFMYDLEAISLFKDHSKDELIFSEKSNEGEISKTQCALRCTRNGNIECVFTEWIIGHHNQQIGDCQVYFRVDGEVGQKYSVSTGMNGAIMVPYEKVTIAAIDGAWSTWQPFSPCSVTCGGGIQTVSRTCNNPAPENGGLDCTGNSIQENDCNTNGCQVDGAWSTWQPSSPCSVTCGGGIQAVARTCNNPAPENGGLECVGNSIQENDCNTNGCPVNGAWSEWVQLNPCHVECGGGSVVVTRTCTNPSPENGGLSCPGSDAQKINCNTDPC